MRFLSEVGGGTVAGFQGKGIVLVEDGDGFRIPMNVNDVIVVGDEDYSTRRMVENKAKGKPAAADDDDSNEPADKPVAFKAPAEERKGGDQLSAYLAFVPIDLKAITSSRFETYFVNDSNYYMRYAYFVAEGASWKLHSTEEVEPNTKLFVEEFGRDDLNDLGHVCLQVMAYKRGKAFELKPTVSVQLRIDSVKFYKLHTFQDNDFFEQQALIYPIVENDKTLRPLSIDAERLMEGMMDKAAADVRPKQAKQPHAAAEDKNAPLVVDLHASELLDTTAGMSAGDILNYQVEVFRKTIKQYESQKGKKIVFIHGKGEGVLRHAIVNDLRYRFKSCLYQDASFREYGYGATLVTIR